MSSVHGSAVGRSVTKAGKARLMSEEELPAFARRMISSMQQSIRQKWYEAVTTYFARAIINHEVAQACRAAGFHDANIYFTQKAVWLLAQGIDCYGKMLKV